MKNRILRRILILVVAPLLFAGALGCWESPFPNDSTGYTTFEYDVGSTSNFKLSVGFLPRVEFLDQMIDKDVLDYPPPSDYVQDVCKLILSDEADTTSEVINTGQCDSFFYNAEDYRDTGTVSEVLFKFNVPKQRIIDCRDGVTDVCVVQLEAHASFTYVYFGNEKYDDATYTSPVILNPNGLDLSTVIIIPKQCGSLEVWNESSLECLPVAPLGVCGDGTVDPGEACDDGNTISGDGCSDLCVLETVCDDDDQDGICNTDDTDNDNDGWTDVEEDDCLSDPLDANSVPEDLDGDGTCDILDDDPSRSTNTGGGGSGGTTAGTGSNAAEFGGGNCSLNPNATSDFNTFVFLALLCLTTPIAVTLHIRKRR